MSKKRSKDSNMQWYVMDLHLHSPASADYEEDGVSYLDMLRKAEQQRLDIMAFTDHNTVGGYAAMMDEIEQLSYLEKINRIQPDEAERLKEYRRLLDKILVLPGFEFTATFGFHILGIFAPNTSIREIEHVLLTLNVPQEVLDDGGSEVGASSDVLRAYEVIREHDGLAIAAHVNSTHGIFDRRRDIGGQTRIAYTQDSNLHALELTDWEKRGRGTTARFFDGTKPEYPRRMHFVQSSDAHRIHGDPKNPKRLGIGERVTEANLPECSFEALKEVFEGNDFARLRPYRGRREPLDHIQAAREEGESIVLSFHESVTRRGGRLFNVLADICAFANTNGGAIYLGVNANPQHPPVGIESVPKTIEMVRHEIDSRINPPLSVQVDAQETQGKTVIRIQVPRGDDPPYVIDDNKVYVRDETETNLAVRDEIVRLVLSNKGYVPGTVEAVSSAPPPAAAPSNGDARGEVSPPRTGVEIVGTEQRKGTKYHVMRDLRNGNMVKNVTRSSARRLWHYAIMEKETKPVDPAQVDWQGDIGLWKTHKRGGVTRYDLVQRMSGGEIRVYYGVTNDGVHGPWDDLIGEYGEDEE
ncbi:MAG: putative DNA binding domain-containing protein [Anaerolineae bacterium]|nr:putative DNA binding domain-containing protein [Anaerolineae bacterium]